MLLFLSCAIIAFALANADAKPEAEAEAGFRRDPDWSHYHSQRKAPHAPRPTSLAKRPKYNYRRQLSMGKRKAQTNKSKFAKRISPASKNPISAQYPAKPSQPLGVILNVGDHRKSYKTYYPAANKKIVKKSFQEKKATGAHHSSQQKKLVKRKGLRPKVRLVRRKQSSYVSKPHLPSKFHAKKGSSFVNSFANERVFSDFYPTGTIGQVVLSGDLSRKIFNSRPKSRPSKEETC